MSNVLAKLKLDDRTQAALLAVRLGMDSEGRMTTEHALAFDQFVLDPVAGGLYGNSGVVALTPRALALLEYLAVRPGRLASKRELMDALWPHAWVTDGVLCVREIRRALDDDARSPRFIETARRRGYRFIAPVEHTHRPGLGLRSASPADVGRPHGHVSHEFLTSP